MRPFGRMGRLSLRQLFPNKNLVPAMMRKKKGQKARGVKYPIRAFTFGVRKVVDSGTLRRSCSCSGVSSEAKNEGGVEKIVQKGLVTFGFGGDVVLSRFRSDFL
eukprot:scaffold1171_cov177-Amphora_coffeaeformis.AAC.7